MSMNQTFLFIKVSAIVEQSEVTMEKMLHALHRLLPQNAQLSLELASSHQFSKFYLVVEKKHTSLVTSQIYAHFPEVEIQEIDEYLPSTDKNMEVVQIDFKYVSAISFKNYKELSGSWLKTLFAVFSHTDPAEEIFIQIALKKVGTKVYERGLKGLRYSLFGKNFEKTSQDVFVGKFRIGYLAESKSVAKSKIKPIFNLLKNFKGQNELRYKKFFIPKDLYHRFLERSTKQGDFWTPEELATLYHLPTTKSSLSHVVHVISKHAPPPDFLPTDGNHLAMIGETTYHNEKTRFGIMDADRRRHMYVIGKTGVGKSRFLELLMTSDIETDKGFCLIDPHGDLAEAVISHIPKHRIKDVVYVDPTNREFPIAFNPLEYTLDYEKRQHLVYFFISIFKKVFAADWNERMEHILRFILLALLETSDSNILGIPRILSDTKFRQRVVNQVQDPVVKQFWANEFSSWNEQYSSQAIVPILNKVGQFISNPLIRNMIGQQKNRLDFTSFINTNKIIIINVSKGKLGEENAALLGSMFITKIQQAALSRANIPEDERVDFYLYIDEFQNFATDAFRSILSESRKYRLNLTVAHQYMAQLSDDIKSSVFGNVASFFVFAVGGEDAFYLEKELSPIFKADDMIKLETREMYVKMSINGRTAQPFSARTLATQESNFNFFPDIIASTQTKYAANRVAVEKNIEKWQNAKESMTEREDSLEEFPEPII